MTLLLRRKLLNSIVLTMSGMAAVAGLFMLAWILGDVAWRGLAAINWNFFTELPTPAGVKGGGLLNAIVGTLLMTGTAAAIAVPFGMMSGTYLAEFGKNNLFGQFVRFIADILVSAPSIVIGVFVYLILVKPMHNFSGWAGACALAIIMLPVVSRTTEEMLRLVPPEIREASLALGSPYWKMTFKIIYRSAASGIFTGVMLAVARVAGETAPLLFTALNSPYWMHGMNEPMANLTVVLFNYAMSPYDDWHMMAWGAAFIITITVLAVNIFTRIILRSKGRRT
jgi:phosphate transport system permease protein